METRTRLLEVLQRALVRTLLSEPPGHWVLRTRAAVSSEHNTGNTHLQHLAVNEGGKHTAAQKETRRGKKGWEEALGSLKCKKKKKKKKKKTPALKT